MTPPSQEPIAPRNEEPQGAPFRILFVCTGNTCRSPMAEAIARRDIARRGWRFVEVGSAGVAAYPGSPASPEAVQVAGEAGLPLDGHRARPFSPALLGWADLILVMGRSHLRELRDAGGGERIHMLGDFATGAEGTGSLPDPFGGPVEAYRDTFRRLEQLVGGALDRVEPFVAP